MEPATFRLVAQCLNQLRYCVPLTMGVTIKITVFWGVTYSLVEIYRRFEGRYSLRLQSTGVVPSENGGNALFQTSTSLYQ